MRITIKLIIARLVVLALLFSALGYASEPSVVYQITGLDQDLIRVVQQHLDQSLPTASRPSSEKIHCWYQHSLSDIQHILAAYGYFKPSICPSLKQKGAKWYANYQISPGPPLRITLLEVSVQDPRKKDPPIEKSIADFPLHQGDIFSSERYEHAKQLLLATAIGQGYLSAYFSKHTVLINRKSYTARITLTLNKGPRYYFGPIIFQQSILKDNLLRRYIPFKIGAPYSSTQLLSLQENLNKSGYFSNVSINAIKTQKQALPVTFTLTPRPSQQYTAGRGYSTDLGIRGTLGWESRYLNKSGHRLNIISQLSKIQNSLQMTYRIPGKHPNTDSYNINYAIVRKKLAQVVSTTQQLGFSHIAQWGGWRRNLFLNYQIERFNYLNSKTTKAHLLTPGINFSRSKFDNARFALCGYRLNLRLQGADQHLLSNTSFLQTQLQGKYILSWNKNSRLLLRGDMGYTLTSNLNDFPPSLLFYVGGSQSLRGYAYQALGPGRYLMLGSIEYQHRLINDFYGAVFFDAGNAVNNFPINLQKGAGIGLVWLSPLGPMEVTAGKALNLPGRPIRLQFTMGFDLL
jgi:translocation and assembly module TamA